MGLAPSCENEVIRALQDLRIRKEFGLYANLRPVQLPKALAHACPLRPERQGDGIDILVVRELTGGIYFGKPKGIEKLPNGEERGVNTEVYTTEEIRRIAKVAFEAGGSKLEYTVEDSGGVQNWITREVGTLKLKPGRATITVKPLTKPGVAVMDLQEMTLSPAKETN